MNDLTGEFQRLSFLVHCGHCGIVYDAGRVKVIARYADCSVWKSPCCNRTVDDRQWKSLPDIIPLSAQEVREMGWCYEGKSPMGYQTEALKHFRNEVSGPQRRVLRSLRYTGMGEWKNTAWAHGNVVKALERRGLVEARWAWIDGWTLRLTEQGRKEAIR